MGSNRFQGFVYLSICIAYNHLNSAHRSIRNGEAVTMHSPVSCIFLVV